MKYLEEYPIEKLSAFIGLIIIALGIYLGQIDGINSIIIISLSLLGSFLSSISTTWIFGKSAAKKQFISKLCTLRNQLHTTAAQINSSVEGGLSEDEDPHLSLVKINQSLNTLSMVLYELDTITDQSITSEKDNIIQARNSMIDLGNSLKSLSINAPYTEKEGVSEKLAKSISALDGILGKRTIPSIRTKKSKKEVVPLTKEQIILASVRKRGMQFLGINTQLNLVKNIFETVKKNTEYKNRNDLINEAMEGDLADLIKYGTISKTKISGVFNIFYKINVFDKKKESEESPTMLLLSERYKGFKDFMQAHNSVFYAIANDLNIEPIEIDKILRISETDRPTEDAIKEVNVILNRPSQVMTMPNNG